MFGLLCCSTYVVCVLPLVHLTERVCSSFKSVFSMKMGLHKKKRFYFCPFECLIIRNSAQKKSFFFHGALPSICTNMKKYPFLNLSFTKSKTTWIKARQNRTSNGNIFNSKKNFFFLMRNVIFSECLCEV